MKKVISLLLVMLLVVVACPAFATDSAPADKFVLKMDAASDVTNFNHRWGIDANALTAAKANTTYTKLSTYSAPWVNHYDQGNCQFKWAKNLDFTVGDYNYFNMWVYSNEAFDFRMTLNYSPSGTAGCEFAVQPGWNLLTAQLFADTTNAVSNYSKLAYYSSDYSVTGISFNSDGKFFGATVAQEYSSTREVYFDSIFLTQNDVNVDVPEVVSTSIPDEAEGVSSAINEYVLTFDSEVRASTVTTDNINIKETVTGTVITPQAISASGKNVTLTLAEGSLVSGVNYTVTVSDAVENVWGIPLADDASYTFAVASSTVTPIATMVAPQAGAMVADNNAVLKVTAVPSDAVNKVEFFEGDTLLGAGVKGANDEYSLNYADFTVGEHTVYAVVTYNNYASTVNAAPVSFTVLEAVDYELFGISDGEKIIINCGDARNYTKTIGLNDTTNVSKVVYKLDGEEMSEKTAAPFSLDITFEDTEEHTVSADVYDIMGGVQNLDPVTYQAEYVVANDIKADATFDNGIVGEAISVDGSDFFNYQRADSGNPHGSITYAEDPVAGNTNLVAKVVSGVPSGSGHDTNFGLKAAIPASKRMRIEFDLYANAGSSNPTHTWLRIDAGGYYWGSTINPYNLHIPADRPAFKSTDAWNHVTVIIDVNAMNSDVYVNGAYHKSMALPEAWKTTTDAAIMFMSNGYTYYLDNISIDELVPMTAVTEPLFDKVTFTDNETAWNADFVLANLTDAAEECKVFYAVYDANDNLIAINGAGETVELAAGNIVHKLFNNIPKTYGTKTGTKVRGFVWESVDGVTTMRPLNEIK